MAKRIFNPTIAVSDQTKLELDKYKITNSETYDETISRILKAVPKEMLMVSKKIRSEDKSMNKKELNAFDRIQLYCLMFGEEEKTNKNISFKLGLLILALISAFGSFLAFTFGILTLNLLLGSIASGIYLLIALKLVQIALGDRR